MQRIHVDTRRLVGGAHCLDFANSVDWASDGSERPSHTDLLKEPADLTRWGRRLGLLADDTAPPLTGRELSAARRLRLAVHRVFAATACGTPPDADSMTVVLRTYAEAAAGAELEASDGRWQLVWPAGDARRIRFAVAASAIDLLRDPDRLSRVRQCPGRNCGWLFLDATGRRRWCSMEVCGSRAKMRAHYHRQRQRQTESRQKT